MSDQDINAKYTVGSSLSNISNLKSRSPRQHQSSQAYDGRRASADPAVMSLTNCRFYEGKFPEIDSFVMVNVRQVCCIALRGHLKSETHHTTVDM